MEASYTESDSVISKPLIKKLKCGRIPYLKLLKEIVSDEQYNFHSDMQLLHFLVRTDDMNIIHVDSTLTYRKDKLSDFFIGTYALKEILKGCDLKKPTIVLSHYSLDSFEPTEQKAILRLLKDNHVQLWLAGHKHNHIIHKDYDYFYVAHSGNQTFEKHTTPSFIEGFLDTDTGCGYYTVHNWNENSDWAVYQTLSDSTDENSYDPQEKTKYSFVLQDWLKANGKDTAKQDDCSTHVLNYLKDYRGNSFLLETISKDLKLSGGILLQSLEALKERGYIKPINHTKTQWEIIKRR